LKAHLLLSSFYLSFFNFLQPLSTASYIQLLEKLSYQHLLPQTAANNEQQQQQMEPNPKRNIRASNYHSEE
jgi:hypothetical protein